jgi:hypothetical protein
MGRHVGPRKFGWAHPVLSIFFSVNDFFDFVNSFVCLIFFDE